MTQKAVIYARFSSDNQRDASIDDQIRVCRVLIEQQGWQCVQTYTDYAISGATLLRPGYQAMGKDAQAYIFDIVVAESLDRISRDQEHIARFYKQMSHRGIKIWTRSEGLISELHVGLKGTMGALYLKDLAEKTHRGLEGRVRSGHSAGGLAYGYRVVRQLLPDGSIAIGDREIVMEEAAVIRSIFDEYVRGQSPRAIAKRLNGKGVRGPRGGRWTASLILGNAQRETGILRNRLYAGEIVWNRQRYSKDPDTGKRGARPRDRSEWIVEAAPAMRIIDQEVWETAQRQLEHRRQQVLVSVARGTSRTDGGKALASTRRPKWLLSGLVRCGLCNGPLSVVSSNGRLGCANRRERDTCSNSRTILRRTLEQRVLIGLKQSLLAPALVEAFMTDYVAEVNRHNRERGDKRGALEREAGRIRRQIANTIDLIKDGSGSRSLVEELRKMEAREDEIALALSTLEVDEPIPILHPNLPELYRGKVERLEDLLKDETISALAAEALRSLIEVINVYPGERRGETRIELRGDLAAFLRLPGDADGTEAKTAVHRTVNSCSAGVMGTLVAGTGFEPVTFRL